MVSRAKEKLHEIFTYGTLKTGQSNHHELTDPEHGRCKLLGTGRTQQTFPLVLPSNYDYPFLLNKERLGHVSVLIVIMKWQSQWKVSEKNACHPHQFQCPSQDFDGVGRSFVTIHRAQMVMEKLLVIIQKLVPRNLDGGW